MAKFAKAWVGFNLGDWCENIDVRDFIQKNYTPYEGDEAFLAPPTERTRRLMAKLEEKLKEERDNGGIVGIDTETVTSLTAYPAAYLDQEDELIVCLQTGAPLVRSVNPFGGIRMARSACKAYGTQLSEGGFVYWIVFDDSKDQSLKDLVNSNAENMAKSLSESTNL
jgi:formate C-acetyltransferase